MEHNIGLEDVSMLNNVGSVTEEGPHLSDCEDTFSSVVDSQDVHTISIEQTAYDEGDQLTDQAASTTHHGNYDGRDTDPSVGGCIKHTNLDCLSSEGAPKEIDEGDKPPEMKEMSNSTAERQTIKRETEGLTVKNTANSIYIDNGMLNIESVVRKVDPKPKRLTMAQRAAMEALASFGGCSLSSIPVRKIDLHVELEQEKERAKKRCFDDGEEVYEDHSPPTKRPRTRLQAAKQEAEKAFENIALAEGPKSYSTLQRLKVSAPQSSQRPMIKTRVTRVEKSKREALKSFGGASLDSLPTKPNNTDSANVQNQDTSTGRRPTRVEQARLEALQAFGGGGLQDIMTTSKRKIAQHLESSTESGHCKNKENMDHCEEHIPV